MNNVLVFSEELYHQYEVESDMHSDAIQVEEWDSIEKIAYLSWKNLALVGLYELSEEQHAELLDSARRTFSKLMVNTKVPMTPSEEQVFSLSIIEIAKNFDEDENDGGLWDFIFSQLGYDKDLEGTQSNQVLYGVVRSIFQNTILKYSKYFAEEGHKYYNSINIHALAPAWSAEHLINILFSFYAKNLEYHYEQGDRAFLILTQNIAMRWLDGQEATEEDLRLRSDVLSSSFKFLFKYRPGFMAALCDSIVGKIDSMLKSEFAVLDAHNRLDGFISQWFNRQTEKERQQMADKRRNSSTQKVVTSKKDIKAEYFFEDGCLYIRLPRIRLPEIKSRPTVCLYQDETPIDTQTLRTIGDDLCMTTRELSLPLSTNQNVDWSKEFRFRIRITSGEQEIYDSGTALYRQYIVLNQAGEESRSPKLGAYTVHLLVPDNGRVVIKCDEDAVDQLNHKGQFFVIPLAVTQTVQVNGRDIFLQNGESQTVSFYLSKQEEKDVMVLGCGEPYTVFGSPFVLYVSSSTPELGKNYRIYLDTAEHSVAEYQWEDNRYVVSLPRIPRYCHSISVKNFTTGNIVFSLNYIILSDFSCEFDQEFYKNVSCEGSAKIRIGGRTVSREFSLSPDQDEIALQLWDKDLKAVIRVPKLSISLSGENAFLLNDAMWVGDIDKAAFLSIHHPNDLVASVQLGGYAVPRTSRKNVYDLGNFLASKSTWTSNSLPLGIILRRNDVIVDEVLLTQIIFHPFFSETPVLEKDKKLLWAPEDKYYGPPTSEFYVKLYHGMGEPDPYTYFETLKADVLEKKFPFPDGYYRYEVVLCGEKTVFEEETDSVLLTEQLRIGDPNTARWSGKELHLTKVLYWSNKTRKEEIAPLFYRDGIITDIEYVGLSIPTVGSEEDPDAELPEYSAYLQYEKFDGSRYDYNYREDKEEYELINPIRLWVTPDDRILIQTRAGEGESLMVNTKRPPDVRSATARLVYSLTRIEIEDQKKYVFLADSFYYEESKEEP